jgi:hypothetical protein
LLATERSIIDEGYFDVYLVGSAPHNRGQQKEFNFVGPRLFSFAFRRSIGAGCEGFVAMTAKIKLIGYYHH